MSTGGDTDVGCGCGHRFSAWLWQSANVTADPRLRDSILDGSMNVVTCPSCGNRFHVEVPFLYHDMQAKEWIWVYPLSYQEMGGEVNARVAEMWKNLTRAMPSGVKEIYENEYRVLVFFGMDALVCYLHYREGADGDGLST